MRKSRLSKQKQERLIEHFVAGPWARQAGVIIGVNDKSSAYYYHRLRLVIKAETDEAREKVVCGEIEADESYFGGVRKGRRGRGAAGKVPVFGLLKRGGNVYAEVIKDASSDTQMPIMKKKIQPDSIVYTDQWSSYNALDVSGFRHLRINHSCRFAGQKNHINGIENFWSQAKRQMSQYNGLPRQHVELFLRECEWRFNHNKTKRKIKL